MSEAGRPAVRLARPLRWDPEPDGRAILVRGALGESPIRARAWTADVLEGLARGEGFDALEARAVRAQRDEPPERATLELRHFLFALQRLGHVDIPAPEPAPLLRARFERERELGRGGIGVAWCYRDLRDGGRVVVKRAWDFYGPLARVEDRLRHEADVLARFDHAGVVRLVDAFEDDGAFHLVRGYSPGPELESLLGRGEPDAAQRLGVLDAVADALDHVHARGFVLVSVRPSNFHLAAGRPLLIDVGHCRPLVGGVATLPSRRGTPGYTPPEVARGKRATVRSDVWGLARLHAFLATGRHPAAADEPSDLAQRALAAGVPDEEVQLFARCGADAPEERPAGMAEVRAGIALSASRYRERSRPRGPPRT